MIILNMPASMGAAPLLSGPTVDPKRTTLLADFFLVGLSSTVEIVCLLT